MKNDTVSKEIQYQELIADVQKAYLSESRELRWCKECKEINLWAYWQGRGHLDADIMLVGQDWGCPKTSVETMKNVCDMNCGKAVSYMRGNDSITDPDDQEQRYNQYRVNGGKSYGSIALCKRSLQNLCN